MEEAIQKGPQMWADLHADVQAAMDAGIAPTDPEGPGLARRWFDLVTRFTGGDPGIFQSLKQDVPERGQSRRHGREGDAANAGLRREGPRRRGDQAPGAVTWRRPGVSGPSYGPR